MKCSGNCATCDIVENDSKQACCSVQILKNIVEVKSILVDIREKVGEGVKDVFTNLPDFDSEPIVVGAEKKK